MAINVNVLEAWRRFCPRARLTSVVSYCMYPDHARAHPESELFGTEPEADLYAYAFTKKALVIGQRAYCQEFGLSAVSAVLPTVYGPGDSFAEDSHVMSALIGKFCRARANGDADVEAWGDGLQEREFLYVDDAVFGILAVANPGASPELNIGSGEGVSIATIADIIRRASGFAGHVRFNPARCAGAHRRVMSTELMREQAAWRPQVGLDEGILRTMTAYQTALQERAGQTSNPLPVELRAP